MRIFVPEIFKHPGAYWARMGTKSEQKRRHQRIRRIYSEAKPGNSHFLILPSSMAIEDRVRPGECHSSASFYTRLPGVEPSASISDTPSEQVKKVGGEHANQHPDDPNTVARLQPRAAAQGTIASSEAGTNLPEPAASA